MLKYGLIFKENIVNFLIVIIFDFIEYNKVIVVDGKIFICYFMELWYYYWE